MVSCPKKQLLLSLGLGLRVWGDGALVPRAPDLSVYALCAFWRRLETHARSLQTCTAHSSSCVPGWVWRRVPGLRSERASRVASRGARSTCLGPVLILRSGIFPLVLLMSGLHLDPLGNPKSLKPLIYRTQQVYILCNF